MQRSSRAAAPKLCLGSDFRPSFPGFYLWNTPPRPKKNKVNTSTSPCALDNSTVEIDSSGLFPYPPIRHPEAGPTELAPKSAVGGWGMVSGRLVGGCRAGSGSSTLVRFAKGC